MTEEMDDSFFSLLRVVCKGLDGQSASLDSNLSKLRKELMNSGASLSEQLVKDIEQDIRVLSLEKQENKQDFLDIGATWQRNLKKHSLDTEQTMQLAGVAGDFRDSKSHIYKIAASYKVLLNVQLALEKVCANVEQAVTAEISNEETQVKDPLLNTTTESPADTESVTYFLRKASDEMLQLLHQIVSSDQHEKLVLKLKQGLQLQEFPAVISEISGLIESVLALKGNDFSNYLHDLNKQLSEVQEFISNTQNIDAQSFQHRKAADGTVRNSVVSIRDAVNDATEIEMLQEELSIQLNQIVGAMDSLKSEEQKRKDELLSNYNVLKERVNEMEQEAEKVQDFIVKERKKARLDELTRLPNRTAYNEIINHQLENFKRYDKPLTLVVCDLDHFKLVNDSYGHLAGDKVLSLVAKILSKGTRASDFVTRYGGEEFALILPATDAKSAARVMDKIRRLICKSPFNYRGDPISISMSFGVTEAIESDSIESFFTRADEALYKAKASGRNKVCEG
jgi:diguanylate cyclase